MQIDQFKRREFLTLVGGVAMLPFATRAQQAARVPKIGWIILGSPAGSPPDIFSYFDSFRQGLVGLGYVPGRNVEIISRTADGVSDRLPGLIDSLLQSDVSVVVSPGPAIRTVRERITSIPVVFAFSGDPVAGGLVDTLSRGRGNLTGLTYMAVELNGKRINLLRELLPGARRVTLLTNPIHPGEQLEVAESQRVATALGMELDYLQVRTPAEFGSAFAAMRNNNTEAIVAVPDNLVMLQRHQLSEFAKEQKIPVISGWGEFARAGGLMTYGPNSSKFFGRLGVYVDKILKGAKPTEIPIEQPTTFELVINLKTAKELGLDVPPTLLARADEVIE
jgi:putative ABC transport system substrate-binding protein